MLFVSDIVALHMDCGCSGKPITSTVDCLKPLFSDECTNNWPLFRESLEGRNCMYARQSAHRESKTGRRCTWIRIDIPVHFMFHLALVISTSTKDIHICNKEQVFSYMYMRKTEKPANSKL